MFFLFDKPSHLWRKFWKPLNFVSKEKTFPVSISDLKIWKFLFEQINFPLFFSTHNCNHLRRITELRKRKKFSKKFFFQKKQPQFQEEKFQKIGRKVFHSNRTHLGQLLLKPGRRKLDQHARTKFFSISTIYFHNKPLSRDWS